MWQSFKNYFITAQLIAGLAMAAKLSVDGWRYAIYGTFFEHLASAMAWCISGFAAVMLLTAPYALVMAAIHRARLRRLLRQIGRR